MRQAAWRNELDWAEQRAADRHEQQQRRQGIQPKPIHLVLYIESAFDGTNNEANVSAAASSDDACREMVAAVERRVGRPLMTNEYVQVTIETALAWNRRLAQRKANLVETQQRLHNPMFGFAR